MFRNENKYKNGKELQENKRGQRPEKNSGIEGGGGINHRLNKIVSRVKQMDQFDRAIVSFVCASLNT